ncbi:hypothetical protein BHM03_00036881 [Ensete ventricosum]|nr:hypothetical protein BHM03_00036881 [Ensete ventricosum]
MSDICKRYLLCCSNLLLVAQGRRSSTILMLVAAGTAASTDRLTLQYQNVLFCTSYDLLGYIDGSLSCPPAMIHFKELAAALRARDSPISFEEIYDKLTDYEAYLKRDDMSRA